MKKILAILLSFSLVSLVLADSYSGGGGSSKWDSESNTTVFVDVQYPNAILADGTRRMSGDLDMNANAVTNIDTLRANQIVVQGLYDPTADATIIVDVDGRRMTNIVNVAFADGTVQTSAATPETDPLAVLATGARAMSGNLNLGGNIATNGTYYGSGVGLTFTAIDADIINSSGEVFIDSDNRTIDKAGVPIIDVHAGLMVDPSDGSTLVMDWNARRLTNIVNVAFADGTVQTTAYGSDPYNVSDAIAMVVNTGTLSRADGAYRHVNLTQASELIFDTDFPTNGLSVVSVDVYLDGHSLTLNTNNISGTVDLTLATNAWENLIFLKSTFDTLWYVRQ